MVKNGQVNMNEQKGITHPSTAGQALETKLLGDLSRAHGILKKTQSQISIHFLSQRILSSSH